jgi:ribokinase
MKILTIGGATIDSIAVIDSDLIERVVMRNADSSYLLLEEGRKIEAEEIANHVGGGAVNAAVSAARLGHNVSTILKLGPDARADTILAALEREGVSTRYVVRDPIVATGASVLVTAHERNASVFTFRGSNARMEPADFKMESFAVELVYLTTLSDRSAECFPLIVKQSKAHSAMVACNPGMKQLSAPQAELRRCLANIDILTTNVAEAGALAPWLVGQCGAGASRLGDDCRELSTIMLSSEGATLALPAYLMAMRRLGPRWVVVTDGRNGVFIATPDGILHCPSIETKVAGTAGGGDAFASTFAAYVAEGARAEDAALAGTVNASSVISHTDTLTGLLSRRHLDEGLATVKRSLNLRNWHGESISDDWPK